MPGKLLGAGRAALQRHQEARLHLRLGPRDLGLGQRLHRIIHDIDHDLHHLRRVGRIGAGVEAEEARAGVGRVERVDRVAEAALLAHLLEQPRRHPAAEDVGEDLERE